ncbi:ATP-binding protein [Nocardiopsis mwathae]|nr:ATP-binding protein [Nocardiopsis mwathae]
MSNPPFPPPRLLALPSASSSPSTARTFVTSSLFALGAPQGSVEDAKLMVSEAVANAINHGRAPMHLSLTIKFASVEVEVYDSDPAPLDLPRRRADLIESGTRSDNLDDLIDAFDEEAPRNLLAESGRGLDLITHLSDGRCGWRSCPPGKVVWFSVPTPIDQAPSAIEWNVTRSSGPGELASSMGNHLTVQIGGCPR